MEGNLIVVKDIVCTKCKSTNVRIHDTLMNNRPLNIAVLEITMNYECGDCGQHFGMYLGVVGRHLELIAST